MTAGSPAHDDVPILDGLAAWATVNPSTASVVLLAGAAVAWYVTVRAAAGVFVAGPRRLVAGGLVVGGAVPVAAAAAAFALAGQTEAAVAACSGAAVAVATLVAGLTLLSGADALRPAGDRALLWPLAAGPILLLAGTGGELSVVHVALLLLAGLGGVALLAGNTPARPEGGLSRHRFSSWGVLQLILAVLLGAFGAGLAVAGVRLMGHGTGVDVAPLFATAPLGPMVALPLIGVATTPLVRPARPDPEPNPGPDAEANAEIRPPADAVRGLAVLAAVLVLFVLPLVATVALAGGHAVDFPARLWRIDAAVLLVAGLVLMPAALGRHAPGRLDGLLLVVLYVAYLYVSLRADA